MTNKERSFILGKIFARIDLEKRGEENVDGRIQKTVSPSVRPHGERAKTVVGVDPR